MAEVIKRAAALLCVMASLAGCSGASGVARNGPSPIEGQLLAEIALERGEYQTAVNQYLTVARQSRDPEYARRATELAWDYGFDAHALTAAERWIALQPEDSAAHGYVARLAARFGRIDQALASLAIALGPPEERLDQDYVLLSADLLVSPRQGLALFERLDAQFPETAGIKRSLAELSAQNGDLDRAIVVARQTIALRTDWSATRVWLARLLLAKGERSSAFEQMAFAQENNPGVEYELEFVRLMATAGELDNAAQRLERISGRYPDEVAVVLVGASLLTQSGQLAEAETLYQDLLAAGRCFSECYWNLGALAFEREDYAAAIERFRRVGPGARQQAAVLAQSQARLALGDADGALAVLEAYATDYPKRRFAMLEPRAGLLTQSGRHEEAIALSGLATEYRPWSEAVWLAHGATLEQGGQIDKALGAFRTAWEIAPDSATTQNAYGYTLTISTTRYQEAEALIARALEQEPENPAIMDSMGWVLYKQGRVAAARVWLEQAYALLEDPEVAAHLGELLWHSGERDAAAKLLNSAAETFPENRSLEAVRIRLLN